MSLTTAEHRAAQEAAKAARNESARIGRLLRKVAAVESERDALRAALAFYADPVTYGGMGFTPDAPSRALVDDISYCGKHWGWRPGERARAALRR